MNQAEKADTLAALPGNAKGNRREGGEMKTFHIETYDEGPIRDDADFMTPTEFIKANRQESLNINFFPPKCILNEFCISEIELYDIINNEDEEDRLFTNRELEFREGKRFLIDDIFYAFSLENNQLTIDIADYVSWKNRHKEWCEEKRIIKKQIESALREDFALETELAACREQLEEARRDISRQEDGDFFEAYPVCKLIYDLHLAGKNQAEIRAELIKRGYTNAQTGFLTQEDTLIRSDDTIKKSVARSKKSLKG